MGGREGGRGSIARKNKEGGREREDEGVKGR